jgi:hypothetical protein
MQEKIAIAPVTLEGDELGRTSISDVGGALRLLTEEWPQQRGPRHRDAVETCLKVIDGHRSSTEARRALIEAAGEAGLSVS